MKLGFTGTRKEQTKAQRDWVLNYVLSHDIEEAHHGCCIGSDYFFHRACRASYPHIVKSIVLHPPLNDKFEMPYETWDYGNCVWYPRKDYLARDRDIVMEVDQLIATPSGPFVPRGSGTWYTIAHALSQDKPVLVCMPNADIELPVGKLAQS